MSWVPYEKRRNRTHDFEVSYRFLDVSEGGRKTGMPFQGYRSDFLYEGDDPVKDGIWVIWPEFEDERRNVMLEEAVPVPQKGTARMWILSDDMRSHHIQNIKVGAKGYFVEGPKVVAECTVTKVNALSDKV